MPQATTPVYSAHVRLGDRAYGVPRLEDEWGAAGETAWLWV